MKKEPKNINVVIVCAALIVVVIAIVVLVGMSIPEPKETIQGQAETSDYRVSSKIPARVLEIKVKEGDKVSKGDTLVILEAPDVEAKLTQANAAWNKKPPQEHGRSKSNRHTKCGKRLSLAGKWPRRPTTA